MDTVCNMIKKQVDANITCPATAVQDFHHAQVGERENQYKQQFECPKNVSHFRLYLYLRSNIYD